jgi:hypothetical protein
VFLGRHLLISEADAANDFFDGFVGAAIGGMVLASLAGARVPVKRGPLPGSGRAPEPPPERSRPARVRTGAGGPGVGVEQRG